MRTRNISLVLVHLASTQAFKLLVSSSRADNGTVGALQTLEFDNSTSLKVAYTNNDCGAASSWLELSSNRSVVTCIDESAPGGGMTALNIKSDGSLQKAFNTSTLGGPVSNAFFNDDSAVAVAHYTPPGITTFAVNPNNTFTPLQEFKNFNHSNNTSERQDTSHIHQALLDPTGQFMLFPDLGADLVHVYSIDPETNTLTEQTPLQSKTGYGPRHATFWAPEDEDDNNFLFVVHELSNKIVSYSVQYLEDGGLGFYEVDEVSTFGDREVPKGAAASEIVKSSDNKFIIAANRLGPIFDLPNPDPNNSTMVKSDSLITLRPDGCGMLEFVSLTASGGTNPRHFSLNKDGSKVAVANGSGETKNVVVMSRDCETGEIGDQIAALSNVAPGALTNVQWLME